MSEEKGNLTSSFGGKKESLAYKMAHYDELKSLLQERETEIESNKHCYKLLAEHSEKQQERIATLEAALKKIRDEGPTSCDYNGRCSGFCVMIANHALAARPEAGEKK